MLDKFYQFGKLVAMVFACFTISDYKLETVTQSLYIYNVLTLSCIQKLENILVFYININRNSDILLFL